MLPIIITPINVILVLTIIWLTILSWLLFRAVRHYRFLISKTRKADLKAILEEILRQIEKQNEQVGKINSKITDIEKKDLRHLQKVGFVRFNPFADTGGDQSFCLSLLNAEDDGVVLSSLHSRGQTRIYGKEIKRGKGKELELSKEEEETIKRAKKGRP